MKNFYRVSGVALLCLPLAGCSGGADAQKAIDEFLKLAVDLNKYAFVGDDVLKSLGRGEAILLIMGLGIVCVLGFCVGIVRSVLRGENAISATVDRHWKWLVLLLSLPFPRYALPALNDFGKRIWKGIGFDLNLIRKALGLKLPTEQGASLDPSGLITLLPAISAIPVFFGWHQGYEILLVLYLPFAIGFSALYRDLWPLIAWMVDAILWLAAGPMVAVGLSMMVTGGGGFLGSTNISFMAVVYGVMALNTTVAVIVTTWALWPWRGSDEEARSNTAQAFNLADLGIDAVTLLALLEHLRGRDRRDDTIYGDPPTRPMGELPPPVHDPPDGGRGGNGRGPNGSIPADGEVLEGEFRELSEVATPSSDLPSSQAAADETPANLADDRRDAVIAGEAGESLPAAQEESDRVVAEIEAAPVRDAAPLQPVSDLPPAENATATATAIGAPISLVNTQPSIASGESGAGDGHAGELPAAVEEEGGVA